MAANLSTNSSALAPLSALSWASRGVELALVALVAFIAAQAVWLIGYGDAVRPLDIAPQTISGAGQSARVTDLSILNQSSLFADNNAAVPVVAQILPETRLNLTLRGVRSGTDPRSGAAFIEAPGLGQRSFAVGDEITNSVMLEEIYEDRVIINRRGVRESLFISEDAARRARETQSTTPPSRTPVSTLSNQVSPVGDQATPLSGEPDAELAQTLDIEDWVEGLRLAPSMDDGVVTGFRVRTNSHMEVLRAAGLQPGDIITVLNGERLSSVDAVQRALAGFETIDSFSMTLERDGAPVVISAPLN